MYVLQRQDKILSENNINIAKGVKDLKSGGVAASRRPVLNDLNSNLQVNQRGRIAVTTKPAISAKPTTTVTKSTNRIVSKYVYKYYN